jgi:hypothetical protein
VIYRAVDWITRLESFALPDARHPLLGGPTMCVTTIHGGLNINSVADSRLPGLPVRGRRAGITAQPDLPQVDLWSIARASET